MSKTIKVVISVVLISLIVFFISLFSGSQVYTDLLWFKSLGFLQTFWVMLLSDLGIKLFIAIFFTLFIYINLNFTKKTFLNYIDSKINDEVELIQEQGGDNLLKWLNKKRLNLIYIISSIILGFFFSSISQDVWKIVLRFFNKTPFGSSDPIFGRDIGFYVFNLPFYNFIKEMGMTVVIATIIIVGLIYLLSAKIKGFKNISDKLSNQAKRHLSILITFFLLLKAWDYRLSMYELLFSNRGVAFGASYTDVNASLIALKILFVIAIVLVGVLLYSTIRKNYKILLWGIATWLIAVVILGGLYPGFVQRFQVEPNEIAKETEYINYNIKMTREAYGLSEVSTEKFTVENNLDLEALNNNKEIISNIRLWDSRPLLSTYGQLQELRQYYNIVNVDIDRYQIDGDYRQVMLGAREMDQSLLSGEAQTWVNQTLKYTHGYGLVMSPVNRVTDKGLPEFFIKDIPANVGVDIELNNAAIYYGEKTDNYIVANNKTKEFHYPMGSENVYKNYTGTGGVQLNDMFKKAVYAARFNTLKMLLADEITPQSRIMYYRNIKERVRKAAPFLKYDDNPYLVVVQGKLYWIQDAYTTTDNYPYSEPTNNMGNYIRNSVKVVIDAYNGTMDYYVVDDSDPLALTYQKIFPDLFVDGSEMPDELRKHIRYPEDLFVIQSRLYSTYHMIDPTVFYNKEDLWEIPEENYSGNSIKMKPYYIIGQLPGEEKAEFILMRPFTPVGKNNMVSWMAARSDGEHYGELMTYTFSKESLVFGPMQIESRIDQDSEISQLLSLWSQRGSRVIRGNLLIIPIDDSILYVEPIYLQAESSELPEMKRIVVSYGNELEMATTLDQALAQIFGVEQAEDVPDDLQEILPSEFGSQYEKLLEELEEILQQLRELKGNENF